MRLFNRLSAVCVAMFVLTGATRYLSPTGTDSGSALTEATAWATLAYALGATSALSGGDTLIVLDGEWSGGSEPYNVTPSAGKSGSAGDWTYIIADTNATPIFDATSHSPYTGNSRALDFSAARRVEIRGLVFEDYGEDDTNNSGDNGEGIITAQSNGAGVVVGIRVMDCVFRAEDADSINIAVQLFTADALGADVLDSCAIVGNVGTGFGNAGLLLYDNRDIVIRDNVLLRNGTGGDGSYDLTEFRRESPNGIDFVKNTGDRAIIEDNEIAGFDHGIVLRGQDGVCRRNFIHDLSDDFIWVNPGAVGYETSGWLVEDNVGYFGMDEGIECDGPSTTIRHNTFYRVGDWLVTIEEDDIVVVGNVLCESAGSPAPDNSPGDRAILLGNSCTGYVVENNLFYDTDGDLDFDSNTGATITPVTLSVWESGGHGSGNVEAVPVLIDTTKAATRPFYAGVNLRPKVASPATGLGWIGRTAGALPAGGIPWFSLRLVGVEPDSLNLTILDQFGDESVRYDGSISERDRNQLWIADYLPDSSTAGVVNGEWRVFETGVDDRLIADAVSIASIPATAAAAATAVDAALADDFADIPTDVETQLADDFAGISATISTADIQAIADTVWNPTAAEYRWRTVHAGDSLGVLLGTGKTEFRFTIGDGATLDQLPVAFLQIWQDLAPPSNDVKVVDIVCPGYHAAMLSASTAYYSIAWVPGAYSEKTTPFTTPATTTSYSILLDALPTTPPGAADRVNMTFYTGDFLSGALFDSVAVYVRPLGKTPRAGSIFLPVDWRLVGLTDTNGRVEFELVKSSEIEADGSGSTRTFYELRTDDVSLSRISAGTTIRDIRVRVFEAPDSTNAGVAYNVK